MPEVGLLGEGRCAGKAGPKFVDHAGVEDVGLIQGQALHPQPRILDAGHERTEVELRLGKARGRQAAGALPLRGIELVGLETVAAEERVVAANPMVDADVETVIRNSPVGVRDVVVEVSRCIRQRINAGHVKPNSIDHARRDHVVLEGVA